MQYICLYTNDEDLAESFKIFFEGKYLIRFFPKREDLDTHLQGKDCRCQALIYDAVSPTSKDVKYLHQLRKTLPTLKIIISYVYFEEKRSTERLLANNVDSIIYKPYDFGEVDRRLQSLLLPSHNGDNYPKDMKNSPQHTDSNP